MQGRDGLWVSKRITGVAGLSKARVYPQGKEAHGGGDRRFAGARNDNSRAATFREYPFGVIAVRYCRGILPMQEINMAFQMDRISAEVWSNQFAHFFDRKEGPLCLETPHC